jgi:hypothetical protein
MWPSAYRYKVNNGVNVAILDPTRHMSSHLLIAGHRALVPHEGQPPTCYACDEVGHGTTLHKPDQGTDTKRSSRTRNVGSSDCAREGRIKTNGFRNKDGRAKRSNGGRKSGTRKRSVRGGTRREDKHGK